jgi:hypothetical protein
MSWERQLGGVWGGQYSFLGEFGLNLQSLAAYSQFAAVRCSNGGAIPCAQNAQVRSVQGELNMQALFAPGVYLGTALRFEQPQHRWFADLALSTIFQFNPVSSSGYTNFVAGGTVAFTQTAQTLKVEQERSLFLVLPALSLRAGIRL